MTSIRTFWHTFDYVCGFELLLITTVLPASNLMPAECPHPVCSALNTIYLPANHVLLYPPLASHSARPPVLQSSIVNLQGSEHQHVHRNLHDVNYHLTCMLPVKTANFDNSNAPCSGLI